MTLQKKTIEKTDMMTIALHWSLVIIFSMSLITGLRITITDVNEPLWATLLNFILPQGNMIKWHVWATYPFLLILVAYIVFLMRASLQSRVALDGGRLRSLQSNDHKTRWAAINVMLYWMAFILLATVTVSGLVLYYLGDLLTYQSVAWLHQLATWLLIAYIVLHIVALVRKGGAAQLLKILNPRAAYGAAAVITVLVTSLVGGIIYALDTTNIRRFEVAQTENPPLIDGNPEDLAWTSARTIEIPTRHSINDPGTEVPVSVRMLHDGKRIYALFRWPDSSYSQKHLPLVKTDSGWKVLQTSFAEHDENAYYEDALSVMIAPYSKLGTIYLGDKPIHGKPGPGSGRALHYTIDGSRVDIWHWRSLRSGAAMSQIDDSYFGSPQEAKEGERYTGGYINDPKSAGGFVMNWQHFAKDNVQPLRLPKDSQIVRTLNDIDLDPEASDKGEFWLAMSETVEYDEELDDYPLGTLIPSVLVDGPFQGDRGDVKAVAHWQDGWWTLEATRLLDTGSEYDVAISSAQPFYMRVAVFNHTQHRHSWHPHPVEVVLQ